MGEFPGCVLLALPSLLAPLSNTLGLLACVNQKPRSGEGKVENRNSYLSAAQLPKKESMGRDRRGGWGVGRLIVLYVELYSLAPQNEATGERPQ